jgi:hypothetical protein
MRPPLVRKLGFSKEKTWGSVRRVFEGKPDPMRSLSAEPLRLPGTIRIHELAGVVSDLIPGGETE